MMEKRRKFLLWGSLLGLSTYLPAQSMQKFQRDFEDVRSLIAAVQEHMFPSGSQIPSAKMMHVTQFLFETMSHKSFDKDIRAFVIEGARELAKREKGRFVLMSTEEKEKALRAYEETHYGSSWLARIMTLTMEGMFSDPLYGSNIGEAGWKAIGSYGGFPRPQTRYIAL